jgi:UDPglucose--hexose-1-phosphate uridylyltransferase
MIQFRKVLRDQIEYRFDPLTGAQVRINPARAKRIRQGETREDELDRLIEASRRACPFCPERVETETPRFSREIIDDGRIRIGESLIFPNLNPFGECHAVGTLSKEHFLHLDEFVPEMIRDNLGAATSYIISVHAHDSEAKYPVYMWNYMPPSAGSIIHPHVQILLERQPTPNLSNVIAKSLDYYRENGKNYWACLVEEERGLDERFVVGNDLLSVVASFAPCGFNEVYFIFNGASSLVQLNERQMETFSIYLSKVLKAYKDMGVGSFNLATLSGPIDQSQSEFYWMSAKLISRPYPRGIYTNDSGPMERMQSVWVIDTLPEELAKKIKVVITSGRS